MNRCADLPFLPFAETAKATKLLARDVAISREFLATIARQIPGGERVLETANRDWHVLDAIMRLIELGGSMNVTGTAIPDLVENLVGPTCTELELALMVSCVRRGL